MVFAINILCMQQEMFDTLLLRHISQSTYALDVVRHPLHRYCMRSKEKPVVANLAFVPQLGFSCGKPCYSSRHERIDIVQLMQAVRGQHGACATEQTARCARRVIVGTHIASITSVDNAQRKEGTPGFSTVWTVSMHMWIHLSSGV